MQGIGEMGMPEDFSYREVFRKGKPQHDRGSLFRARHPQMEAGRRAKIFAPFDALRGFSEAVAGEEARQAEQAGEKRKITDGQE